MIADRDLATADPLGLGGLLADAGRVAQLMARGRFADGELLDIILASALAGLAHYARRSDVHQPASRRLAFRELGLAIGLHALPTIRDVGNARNRGVAIRAGASCAAWRRHRILLAGSGAPPRSDLVRTRRHQRRHAGDESGAGWLPDSAASGLTTTSSMEGGCSSVP